MTLIALKVQGVTHRKNLRTYHLNVPEKTNRSNSCNRMKHFDNQNLILNEINKEIGIGIIIEFSGDFAAYELLLWILNKLI